MPKKTFLLFFSHLYCPEVSANRWVNCQPSGGFKTRLTHLLVYDVSCRRTCRHSCGICIVSHRYCLNPFAIRTALHPPFHYVSMDIMDDMSFSFAVFLPYLFPSIFFSFCAFPSVSASLSLFRWLCLCLSLPFTICWHIEWTQWSNFHLE